MHYSFFRSVFLKAAVPVVLASLVWQSQQLPTRGNAISQSTVGQSKVNQSAWNSVLHVARLVERNQRSSSLVLQLEVLNKPQTTYANAVYQVFARTRGSSDWQEIHTNRGARLITGSGGKYILESEVISINDLEAEIRDEMGADLSIEDVELDCVVSIRYDLAGGGRDLRERFTYRQSYSQISTTTTAVIVGTSSTVTTSRTSSTVVSGQTSNRQGILTSSGRGDDDDDDDDDDDGRDERDDDDDDDDDDGGNRHHSRRRGSNSRSEQVSRSSRRRTEIQSQVTRVWDSVLHVARQTGSSQQNRNLVLQLEILNKPQTTYANVVYQVFAKTRGGRWQEIHTNSGARLIEAAGGKYILTSEVISLTQLEEELRAELGDDLSLEDVEINCVASIRYDLAGGGRDIRESFSYQESYTRIVTTTTTEIFRSSTISATSSSEVVTLSNGFRISLIDVIYQGGASIWKYRVDELASAQDLSNWVLALPACARVTNYTPRAELVSPDPNAGLYGIKWETGAGFSTGIFSVTIQGELTLGAIEVAAKGPDVVLGNIAGPVCGGGSVVIEDDDDDDDDDDGYGRRRRNCNQGIGNGPEGCDPGNSRPHGGSNDEGGDDDDDDDD